VQRLVADEGKAHIAGQAGKSGPVTAGSGGRTGLAGAAVLPRLPPGLPAACGRIPRSPASDSWMHIAVIYQCYGMVKP
jgi:hypothetical protein